MIRKAKIQDVPQLVDLINYYAQKGEMLPRTQGQVYSVLRDFVVIEQESKVVGVGALSIIWSDLAEVRSLAIAPDKQGQGLGRRIVETLLAEARDLELPQVFTLTYKPDFFVKLGFTLADKKDLPHKIWKDCIHCPKFPDCDEIAMVKMLG